VTSNRRRAGLELGAVAALLGILGAAVYGSQALHGGFISDAWSNRALYVFADGSGFSDTVSYLLSKPNIAVRPLQAVYLAVLNGAFGSHTPLWFSWDVITNVLMSLALFALLRKLSLAVFDAAVIAALVLIFPATSSLRFWLATIWGPLSLTLVCLGFLIAFSAFEAKGKPRALTLHAISLTMFVASILLYEVALLIMLSSVLVYRLRVPWRAAASRWIVDCGVLLAVTLTVTLSSSSGHEGTSAGVWQHATTILSQTRLLLATVILPFDSAGWGVLLLLALVPAVSLLAYLWLPDAHPVRPELRRWLLTMAAGVVVVALGYAIYVPGTDYYIPMGPGIADRVNAVPSIGWVLMLYAGIMLFSTLALRDLPRARILSSGLAAVVCALIAVAWLKSIGDYSGHYIRAHDEDERVLSTVRSALPAPPSHSTIWTFGQPVEIVPGVPVFGNTWDMTSSVQLTLDDPTLSSYVAVPGIAFFCRQNMVLPGGAYAIEGKPNREFASPYGRTFFLDTNTGRVAPIRSRAQCHHGARTFAPSPSYAS
jgi:hypothetical protein